MRKTLTVSCPIYPWAAQQLAEPVSPTNQWLWYTVAVASSDTNGAKTPARRLAQKGCHVAAQQPVLTRKACERARCIERRSSRTRHGQNGTRAQPRLEQPRHARPALQGYMRLSAMARTRLFGSSILHMALKARVSCTI